MQKRTEGFPKLCFSQRTELEEGHSVNPIQSLWPGRSQVLGAYPSDVSLSGYFVKFCLLNVYVYTHMYVYVAFSQSQEAVPTSQGTVVLSNPETSNWSKRWE